MGGTALMFLIIFNVGSILMCLSLLKIIRSLNASSKKKLFVRQVRHLLMADTLLHLMLPCLVILYWPPYGMSLVIFPRQTGSAMMCQGLVWMQYVGDFASLLLEMHISVALTCQFFKLRQTLPLLETSFPFIWFAAVGLSLVQVFFESRHLHPDKNGYCVSDTTMPLVSPLFLLTDIISLSSYVFAAVASRNAPHTVQAKKWRMAMMYPCNALLTTGCYAVGAIWQDAWKYETYRTLAFLTLSLNGFMNAMTYFHQSRYASSLRFRAQAAEQVVGEDVTDLSHFSFNVRFGAVDQVSNHTFASSTTGRSTREWQSFDTEELK